MSHTAPQRPDTYQGEVRNVAVSFSGRLDTGELLTGTPTIVDISGDSPTDLTISNKVVSTTSLTINGVTVPTGEAVQFTVTGQQSGKSYKILITVATDATPSQDLIGKVEFDTET